MRWFVLVVTFFAVWGEEDFDEHDWEDENVTTLTDTTFQDFVEANEIVVVEFYATWCQHCRMFRTEYAASAKEFKDEPRVSFAKVEASENMGLMQTFDIEGFPTIKIVKGNDVIEFEGDRTASSLIQFVRRQLRGPMTTITSRAELNNILESGEDSAVIVGFLENSSLKQEFFQSIANSLSSRYLVVLFASESEFDTAGAKPDEIILFTRASADDGLQDPKPLIEKHVYTGPLSVEAFDQFTRLSVLPLVGELGAETFSLYADSKLPLLLALTGTNSIVVELVSGAAARAREYGIVTATINASEFPDLFEELGVSPDHVPIVVLDYQNEQHFVFGDREASVDAVVEFVKQIAEAKISPHRKTQEAPENNDGPVKVVVGSTFETLAIQDDKDVLLEFYAPWCGHCKKLEPKYIEVGEYFQSVPSVLVAKMDITANDPPARQEFRVEGIPTIVLIRSDGKVVPFTGDRSARSLIEFVHTHTSIPFELPAPLPEPEQSTAENFFEDEDGLAGFGLDDEADLDNMFVEQDEHVHEEL